MSITFRCTCGKQSDLPETFLGKRVRCNFCGALSIVAEQAPESDRDLDWETHIAESLLVGPSGVGGGSTSAVLEATTTASSPSFFDEVPSGEMPAASDDEAASEPEPTPAGPPVENPKEYKVLTQRDKWFAGKFGPERLEEAINFLARQGWVVRSMAVGAILGFFGNREELVVLLERG